jgi:hypothetical protein
MTTACMNSLAASQLQGVSSMCINVHVQMYVCVHVCMSKHEVYYMSYVCAHKCFSLLFPHYIQDIRTYKVRHVECYSMKAATQIQHRC